MPEAPSPAGVTKSEFYLITASIFHVILLVQVQMIDGSEAWNWLAMKIMMAFLQMAAGFVFLVFGVKERNRESRTTGASAPSKAS